ncbi:hypothetical protein [Nocardia sp. NBC_01009]|uniref:hypothetical protein n=1 Tax=Nocardia sp. NBC_01009 TaxID=2975996 RepID=UPI003865A95A|nr:hypothetical protein OHA42_04445 [Nocardia sp. NBC_01009]
MTAHKPAQVVRHAAIVLAGAASLSLTVVSGAYIVNQMADTHRAGSELSAPPTATAEDIAADAGPTISEALLTGGSRDLPALFVRLPVDTTVASPNIAAPHIDPAVGTPAGLAGKLRLGTTYVGAQLTPIRADTVAFTVDTNALTVLSDFLLSAPIRDRLGVGNDPAATTQVRTELDTHGQVTVTFSDPTLGEHALRLNRYTAPTPKDAPNATPQESTVTSATTADTAAPETPIAPVDSTPHPQLKTPPSTIDV